jgi:Protein of unknown function (DUF1553)/Protein of unknown function (DUF1549)
MHKKVWILGFVLFWLGSCLVCQDAIAAKPKDKPTKGTSKSAARPAPIRLPESVRQKPTKIMSVDPVSAGSRGDAEAAAARIDSLIGDVLLANQQELPKPADDEVFLRRVYLDVAGRIPTLAEARQFLESKNPNKRQDLVDELLSSPDYVSHFYNFWADTLRLVESPQNNIIATPYLAYVKESIRTNKKYDRWVYEMLTADGKVWDNPATGFQLRDEGMALPYVDNTVRVFLGTQIGCAQCHDHPFDNWTQYQFYELAAFTAGVRTKIMPGDPGFEKKKGNPSNALINQGKSTFPGGKVPGAFQRLARANTYVVREVPAKLKLPHDYAYENAEPEAVVKPAVLWGEIPTGARNGTPREQFAAWLTSADNERFPKTIANRLWRQFFGLGLIEPIDDFNDLNDCANPKLMDYLSSEVVRNDFDLKQFMRSILYSQTYAAQSVDYDMTSGEKFYFSGPVVRRMTAEQVWDSLLTLAVRNPMPFERPTAQDLKPYLDLDFSKDTFASVKAKSEKYEQTYFQPAYTRSLNKHAYQKNVLCRASELPTPLPNDHFIRQFGQGDRESINGSDQVATVPQILAMFNGPITHVMLEAGSAIVDDVVAIETPRDRIDAIFLSVLSRHPSPADRTIAASELTKVKNDNSGYGNIIWGLLNTREFLFIK